MEAYIPKTLPLKKINWSKLVNLIGPANAAIARFDGLIQSIVNPDILLSPLATKEAVLSSKIEGTQATIEEVYSFESNPDTSLKNYEDIQEILNYRKAMTAAIQWMNEKPITLNMMKTLHSILMDSVRGQNKSRGNFRTIQNWIGSPGSKIEQAKYIPPEPLKLMSALDNFEKYIHFVEKDNLVQLAIIHAQFEIIHPFLDGNGRLGRMLIPLFLYQQGIISSPVFYISEYLESYRKAYYEHLNNVSANEDWENWIEFFLIALIKQAEKNIQKAKSIIELYKFKKDRITTATRSPYSLRIIDTLFTSPIFTASKFSEISKIPQSTSYKILNSLETNEIISKKSQISVKDTNTYYFTKLIDIIK